jgi:hypothetical protein
MSITCNSECIPFTDDIALIEQKNYTCNDNIVSPGVLPIKVQRNIVVDNNITTTTFFVTLYHIDDFGTLVDLFSYSFNIVFNGTTFVSREILTTPVNASVRFLQVPPDEEPILCNGGYSQANTRLQLGEIFGDLQQPLWKLDDVYVVSVGSLSAKNIFERQIAFTECEQFVPSECGSTKVPVVTFCGGTNPEGTDIGDVDFKIYDEHRYCKEHKLPCDYVCSINFIPNDDILVTEFNRENVQIASVVRGKGANLYEKLESIFINLGEEVIGVPFTVFYQNIFRYSMRKYVLSRLLYGKFSINFLLGKYNDQFLEDLNNSRFCGYIPYFEDCISTGYGYNKYFKSGRRHCNDK